MKRDPHLVAVCRVAAKLLNVPIVGVSILDDACQQFVAEDGFGPLVVPRDVGICSWTVRGRRGEPLIVPDMTLDKRFVDNPLVTGAPHLRFYAGLPLDPDGGPASAVICVGDVVPRLDFDDARLEQLRDLATFVEAHLRLLGMYDREKRGAEVLRLALDGMDQGLLVTDRDDRIQLHNRQAAELTGIPSALVQDGAALQAVRVHQTAQGEFDGLSEDLRRWLERGEPDMRVPVYERQYSNGNVLEVRTTPTSEGGIVRTYTNMTGRRRAERALREGERRFRLIAENAGDVIILNDLDFTRRYVSPAVSDVLGYEPAELIGSVPLDIVHPDDVCEYLRVVEQVRDGRLDRGLTSQRYRHREGHWVWLEVSFCLTHDLDTRVPDGFVATLRDVTARKAAADDLKASEARQRALIDALPQMMLVVDASTGDALFANQHYDSYFGAIETSRACRRENVHSDDLDEFDRLWLESRQARGRYEAEMRLRRHDGVYRWHKMVMVPVMQDCAIGTLISTALDVHELVGAREELEHTSELLRLAQAAAGAGLWEWDRDRDELTLSPVSARLHGLTENRDADRPVVLSSSAWMARVAPEDAPAVKVLYEGAVDEGTIKVAEFRVVLPHPSGAHRWIQSFGRASGREDPGSPLRYVGLHLDVTARREAEETLKASEARLRISEQRLALALEATGDGLFDTDFENGTHWLSRHWVERLGYDGDLSRKPFEFWLNKAHPDHRAQLRAAVVAHMTGATDKFEQEYRTLRADGTYAWILSRAHAVSLGGDGRPLRVIGTLIDITQRKEAEARVRYMAEHDELTDLANRRLFRRHLDHALAASTVDPDRRAVLVCDLDRFKAINDTLGHLAGDRLLCAAAERLRSVVALGDVVARLGGDEFAIVLGAVDGSRGLSETCRKILAAMEDAVLVDGVPIHLGVSVGGTLLSGGGTGADEVFARADTALFEAKTAGRKTFRLYDAETHARVAARSSIALAMPEAIRRGDFHLVYQPIIDLTSGAVSSFEALMRWSRPERGPISPADFIPVAEESGAIMGLGTWALAKACCEAAGWPEAVRVAVNVSTVQFRGELELAVASALDASGLDPGRLILEVTESALMHDPEQVGAVLGRLRASGVRIALDDFGTGYSSLGYLRRFPFDKLKLDRSFIRDIADPDAAAIVRAVVGIGERLGMGVVAEGVETEKQLELVRQEGCRQVQGFFFSRPLAPEAVSEFIARRRSATLEEARPHQPITRASTSL